MTPSIGFAINGIVNDCNFSHANALATSVIDKLKIELQAHETPKSSFTISVETNIAYSSGPAVGDAVAQRMNAAQNKSGNYWTVTVAAISQHNKLDWWSMFAATKFNCNFEYHTVITSKGITS